MPLQRHVQARGVHHDEHGVQALAGFADDPGGRLIKAHHAGRAAVQAHFFLNALTDHGTAVAVGVELGHQEQRQALRPGRCVGQAGQHQVHDVVAQVVLAAGDEDLGARQVDTAVGPGHGFGAAQAEVGAGVGFGQAHGGQPFAGGDLPEVTRLQFVAAVVFQALVGAVQKAGRHGPAVVGAAEHLVQRGLQHRRQALAAVFRCAGQRRPAGLPEGLVGVPKPRCHGDAACFKARADLIPIPVQGRDHLADELAGLIEHLAHQVRVHLGESAQGLELCRGLQDLRQDEGHVVGAGLVRVHVATQNIASEDHLTLGYGSIFP
jgi:hypothetical protein